MIRKTLRTARKAHRCTCGNVIAVGDRHWEHVIVDEDFWDGWGRLRECSECAVRYDRPVAAQSEVWPKEDG